MVALWWLADEWGVPQINRIPTTHLLLGVGLAGIGQVNLLTVLYCQFPLLTYAASKAKSIACVCADTEHQYVQCHWQEGSVLW